VAYFLGHPVYCVGLYTVEFGGCAVDGDEAVDDVSCLDRLSLIVNGLTSLVSSSSSSSALHPRTLQQQQQQQHPVSNTTLAACLTPVQTQTLTTSEWLPQHHVDQFL